MPLRIPEQYIPAIGKIYALSRESADELIRSLASTPAAAQPQDMVARLAESVSSIPIADLAEIISVLYAMYAVRGFSEADAEEFVDDLIGGISRSSIREMVTGEEQQLRERLARLLGVESLTMVSKAIDIQREGERLYCESRVLSDMRPVFAQGAIGKPLAGVITHTLKLSYHESGVHRDFFVVMDRADLETLPIVLERAREKDRELRAILKEAGIPDFGV